MDSPRPPHGNHDLPATWMVVDGATGLADTVTGLEPAIVHDADRRDDELFYVTNEGLIFADDGATQVIASRALKLVTG